MGKMGFLSLLEISSMPILQVLIISLLGAFMATDYLKLFPADARKSLNKIVFTVFTPSLIFASLAETVQFKDIISWWFMPVNIGITFLAGGAIRLSLFKPKLITLFLNRWFMPVNIGITFLAGGALGWAAVKILRPEPYLQDLIIAMSATGNFKSILLIVIPAICKEDGSPFGNKNVCSSVGLSYVSFSMAIGALYTWTYTYHLIRNTEAKYTAMLAAARESSKKPNRDFEADEKTILLNGEENVRISSTANGDNTKIQTVDAAAWSQILGVFHKIVEQLKAPPILAAIIGLMFGAVTWLRNLIIGNDAPFRVIDDSIKLLGDGTSPCITLILGGNLTQGLSKGRVKPMMVIAVICVRSIVLPAVGIGVVKAASHLGFLPLDPLYQFVLMMHFSLPPSMNIGTMTQLFDVAQEECSLLLLWTYLVATVALTGWSTVFMWILS